MRLTQCSLPRLPGLYLQGPDLPASRPEKQGDRARDNRDSRTDATHFALFRKTKPRLYHNLDRVKPVDLRVSIAAPQTGRSGLIAHNVAELDRIKIVAHELGSDNQIFRLPRKEYDFI